MWMTSEDCCTFMSHKHLMMKVLLLGVVSFFCYGQALESSPVNKRKLTVCDEGSWKLIQNNSFPTGQAKLRFKIEKGYESGSYDAILACKNLVVHGTGSQVVSVSKWKSSHVLFGIVVPKSSLQNEEKDIINNTCSFELRQQATESSPQKVVLGCEMKVLTVLGRIIPHCSETGKKGEELLKHIEVKREQGIVHAYFKSTPNDVVRVKQYCKNNPLKNSFLFDPEVERNGVLVSLNAFGENERIYAINFYPDCDNFNASIRKLFMTKENHDCYVSIYAMCQEGVTLIKSFDVDLDQESMMCPPPKTTFTKTIENAKLKFRIENNAIAVLLIFLCINLILYLLILPCLITMCIKQVIKLGKKLQENSFKRFGGGRRTSKAKKRLSKSKDHSMPQSPGQTTHLMESFDERDANADQSVKKKPKQERRHTQQKLMKETPSLGIEKSGAIAGSVSDVVIQVSGADGKGEDLIDFEDNPSVSRSKSEPISGILGEETKLEPIPRISGEEKFTIKEVENEPIPPLDCDLEAVGEPIETPKTTLVTFEDTKALWVDPVKKKTDHSKHHKHRSHRKSSQSGIKTEKSHRHHHHSKKHKKESKMITTEDIVQPEAIQVHHAVFDDEMIEIERLVEGFGRDKKSEGQSVPPNQGSPGAAAGQPLPFGRPPMPMVPGQYGGMPVRYGDPRQAMRFPPPQGMPGMQQPGMMYRDPRQPVMMPRLPMQGAPPMQAPMRYGDPRQMAMYGAQQPRPMYSQPGQGFPPQRPPSPRPPPHQMFGDPRMMYGQQPPSPMQQPPMRFVDPNQAALMHPSQQPSQPPQGSPPQGSPPQGSPPQYGQPLPPVRHPPGHSEDLSLPQLTQQQMQTPAAEEESSSETEEDENEAPASYLPEPSEHPTEQKNDESYEQRYQPEPQRIQPEPQRTPESLRHQPESLRHQPEPQRSQPEPLRHLPEPSRQKHYSREYEEIDTRPSHSLRTPIVETASERNEEACNFVSPAAKSFHSLKEEMDSKYTLGHEDVDVDVIGKWCQGIDLGAPPPTRRVKRSLVHSSVGTIAVPPHLASPPLPPPPPFVSQEQGREHQNRPSTTRSARSRTQEGTEEQKKRSLNLRRRSSSVDEVEEVRKKFSTKSLTKKESSKRDGRLKKSESKLKRNESKENNSKLKRSESRDDYGRVKRSESRDDYSRVKRSESRDDHSRMKRSESRDDYGRMKRSESRDDYGRMKRSESRDDYGRVKRSESRDDYGRVKRSESRDDYGRVKKSGSRDDYGKVKKSGSRDDYGKVKKSDSRDDYGKVKRSDSRDDYGRVKKSESRDDYGRMKKSNSRHDEYSMQRGEGPRRRNRKSKYDDEQLKSKARPAHHSRSGPHYRYVPRQAPSLAHQPTSSADDFEVTYSSLQPNYGNFSWKVDIKRLSSSSSSLLEARETDTDSFQGFDHSLPFHETIALDDESNTPVSTCSLSMLALCDSSSFQQHIHHASSASAIALSCNTETDSIFPISSSPRSPDSCISLPATLPSYPASSSQLDEEESQSDDNINYRLL